MAGYVDVPKGWTRVASRGFGPFVTREVYGLPDGTRLLWDSRWHRKHAGASRGLDLVGPGAMGWWMGVLFAVGSVCFALGSFPPYATAVGATPDNITFFIGSIFFTTAVLPAVHGGRVGADHRRRAAAERRSASCCGSGTAASTGGPPGIQLIGTVWFNRTTLSALLVGLGASPAHHPVWRPDALGSICFLVSSWLAWAEECHGPFAWRPSRHLVADHHAEPGGLRRLRRVGHRLLRHVERRSCSAWP